MPAPPSPLFPMFRSRLQTNIATEVLLHDEDVTAADLVRRLGVDKKNVSQEVKILVDADILTATTVGRSLVLSANTEAPFYEPLVQLLTIVHGPPVVIAAALNGCPGVQAAYIFGSWAARANGVEGLQPRDVDVLVVSDKALSRAGRRPVFEALDEASESLRRPVNPVFATIDQWRTSDDPFLSGVREGPLVAALPLSGQEKHR